MLPMLNMLLSGPGLIGSQHAKLIAHNPLTNLKAIIAPTTEENQYFANKYDANLYQNIEDAIQSETIDGAIISSPNQFHYAQTVSCLNNKIPVLVEKPITDNIEDSFDIFKQSKALNVPVLVGHHRTYNPLLGPVKQFLQSENFGRLVTFTGQALFYKPHQYFLDEAWRTKKGGGPILINLIHEIGLMRYFCGEIKSVFAIANNSIRGFEVEDTVVISFIFENGALGSFTLSDTAASDKSWELTTGENPAYPMHKKSNCYHFAGTNGSIDFPTMQARTYGKDTTASWWSEFNEITLERKMGNSLERQLQHFIDVILKKSTPLVSALDGHMNLMVIDAIMHSIQHKSMVDIQTYND